MASLPDSLKLVNLRVWDHGLVAQSLSQSLIFPRDLSSQKEKDDAMGQIVPATAPTRQLSQGTFSGTAKALTEVFRAGENRFRSFFDVLGIETSLPQENKGIEHQRSIYQWQPKNDPNPDLYPPHLNLTPSGPPGDDNISSFQIFDFMRLLDTGFVLVNIIPGVIKDFVFGWPDQGATMADIQKRNYTLRVSKKNIYTEPNIGDRLDWYTDEVFAQQAFTGGNPATIEIASADWITRFKRAAAAYPEVAKLLDSADKGFLFVQDCSYFRAAVGAADLKAPMMVEGDGGEDRYATATVTLFYLQPNGKLHPLAIVIDYRGSMEDSVVIFNQRLQAALESPKTKDPLAKDPQETDWPWRFAKTCHMSADWIRHEATVHLTNTHLVEEVVIVAAHRSLPQDHLVYRCLQPHWLKTLALNAGARSALVPNAINRVIGIKPEQTYAFIRDAYKRFNWKENYVPRDLERRGFKDIMQNDRFHNYAYGKTIILMWLALHKFVSSFLHNGGQGPCSTDAKVARDKYLQDWCDEMRSSEGGQMKSFPVKFTTVAELVDAVTMCIHLASPQHTAVNYLQEYYQSFVVNKPPAICHALPKTIDELLAYNEKDLMNALPINRPQEWLLASHITHLLNSPVAAGQDLPNYAVSLYHLTGPKNESGSSELALQQAARGLVEDLERFVSPQTKAGIFHDIAKGVDDKVMPPYKVLYPDTTAVSILI